MTSFWPLFLRLEFPPLIFSIDLSLGVLHIKQKSYLFKSQVDKNSFWRSVKSHKKQGHPQKIDVKLGLCAKFHEDLF